MIHYCTSDPLDTIMLAIVDATGVPVYIINSTVTASPYVFAVPHQVPPPDCFSCHVVATSNMYGVYYRVSALTLTKVDTQHSHFLGIYARSRRR